MGRVHSSILSLHNYISATYLLDTLFVELSSLGCSGQLSRSRFCPKQWSGWLSITAGVVLRQGICILSYLCYTSSTLPSCPVSRFRLKDSVLARQ